MVAYVRYNQDQADLASLCRHMFADHQGLIIDNLSDTAVETHVPALWSDIAGSGLIGVPFPEDVGGSEGTWADLAIVMREAGRALVPSTLSSTVFAATVLDRLGDAHQRKSFLEPLLGEGGIATVAASSLWSDLEGATELPTLSRDGLRWILDGRDRFVPNARLAATHVVAARGEDGRVKFVLVPSIAGGVHAEPHVTFGGDSQHDVSYHEVVVGAEAILTGSDDPLAEFRTCQDVMRVMQAGEMLGGAEHVLEVTAAYATVREQFGVPIGSFQAVQHLLADAASDLAAGEAAWWHAAQLLPSGAGVRREAAAANAWLARTFAETTVTAHQVHGGIGYARENPLHLWSQRARQLELTGGGVRDQLEVVAADLYGDGPDN